MQHHFSPYTLNGGTILAIAGEDFSVVASDMRLSEGFMIHSRECQKTYKLTGKTVLASTGFHGDVLTLTKILDARLKMYEHDHQKTMTANAIAAMLSTMLYYRRFFPYYTYNIIGGLDENGRGCVYSFDPVGSYQREEYRAGGTAGALLQPLLDNQIGFKNQGQGVKRTPLSLEKALTLIKDVFISAAERDIHTGDGVHISIVRADGITTEVLPLRKD